MFFLLKIFLSSKLHFGQYFCPATDDCNLTKILLEPPICKKTIQAKAFCKLENLKQDREAISIFSSAYCSAFLVETSFKRIGTELKLRLFVQSRTQTCLRTPPMSVKILCIVKSPGWNSRMMSATNLDVKEFLLLLCLTST